MRNLLNVTTDLNKLSVVKVKENIMKNYKKVIKERYDRQKYDGKGILNNQYSLINPVGLYMEFKATGILSEFVKIISAKRTFDKIKICDCGCGDGNKTRILAELLGNPDQVYGVEYSINRLRHCKDMNAFIHYEYADLTESGGVPYDTQFDGITAFVVFMHFVSEKEIVCALNNIYNSLKRKGYFLWYELNADSHWDGKRKNVEQWGFSADEMDKYASGVGFKLVKQYGIYAKFPIINKTTAYLAKDIKDIWMLELLEKLPFKKNNLVRIYYKE